MGTLGGRSVFAGLAVIFKYCSETASTKKQLSELTNYNVCCVN